IGALLVDAGAARAQDIPVAVAGPLTGQLAALGDQFKRGAEMAVEDLNAAGGVAGKKLKLELGDDQCDPKQAVAVANQLSVKKVAVVAGHACS
ncbi:ABC transporter substrate-binding protein, partial [Acinetobacter baumannii]